MFYDDFSSRCRDLGENTDRYRAQGPVLLSGMIIRMKVSIVFDKLKPVCISLVGSQSYSRHFKTYFIESIT